MKRHAQSSQNGWNPSTDGPPTLGVRPPSHGARERRTPRATCSYTERYCSKLMPPPIQSLLGSFQTHQYQFFNVLSTPLLSAAPYDFRALFRKRSNRSRVVEGPAKLSKGQKGSRADVDRRLNVCAQCGPVQHRIRRMLIKNKHANNSHVQFTQLGPDALPVRSEREVPPAIRFIYAVLEAHRLEGTVLRHDHAAS